ncbi:MAG: cobalamin biosynthesis protein [Rhodobacteraceae bacterium]|nr:cobalamin biosynthesis protein [Paracoccaceae bacterium]
MTLVLALILDAILGEPKWLWDRIPHPAVLMGRLVAFLDRELNEGPNRKRRGIIAVVIMVLVASAIGNTVAGMLGAPGEIIVGAILLAQRSLVAHVQDVANALRISTGDARLAVAKIVSRDTAGMEPPAIARSAIESAAENLSDGVIAPAFWFLIGGLPGLLLYKFINTADSMIGYRTEKYAEFGWASARLDDLLNLIPARATALILWAVGGFRGSWGAIAADARKHKSPNAGWPEAALSRGLGIALAGPRSYDGELRDFPFVNPEGQKEIGADEIDEAIEHLWRAWGVVLALALGAALL